MLNIYAHAEQGQVPYVHKLVIPQLQMACVINEENPKFVPRLFVQRRQESQLCLEVCGMISVQGCNCQLRFYLVDLRSLSIFALICSGQSVSIVKG